MAYWSWWGKKTSWPQHPPNPIRLQDTLFWSLAPGWMRSVNADHTLKHSICKKHFKAIFRHTFIKSKNLWSKNKYAISDILSLTSRDAGCICALGTAVDRWIQWVFEIWAMLSHGIQAALLLAKYVFSQSNYLLLLSPTIPQALSPAVSVASWACSRVTAGNFLLWFDIFRAHIRVNNKPRAVEDWKDYISP